MITFVSQRRMPLEMNCSLLDCCLLSLSPFPQSEVASCPFLISIRFLDVIVVNFNLAFHRCTARGEEAREVPDGQVRGAPNGAHQEAAARRDVDVREAARVVWRGKSTTANP